MIQEATTACRDLVPRIPGHDLRHGISQSLIERQPADYATAAEAMDATFALLKDHPEAVGATALRKT